MAQENHIPYYMEHKDVYIARARKQYEARNPALNFRKMADSALSLDSGIGSEKKLDSEAIYLKNNPCFYILNLLNEPHGKSHRMISACAEKDGILGKDTRKRDCKKDLNELAEADFIYQIDRNGKKIYFISSEGRAAINYMKSIIGNFNKAD